VDTSILVENPRGASTRITLRPELGLIEFDATGLVTLDMLRQNLAAAESLPGFRADYARLNIFGPLARMGDISPDELAGAQAVIADFNARNEVSAPVRSAWVVPAELARPIAQFWALGNSGSEHVMAAAFETREAALAWLAETG